MFLLIKEFPDNLHKALKAEATKKGFTLKGYIVALLNAARKAKMDVAIERLRVQP